MESTSQRPSMDSLDSGYETEDTITQTICSSAPFLPEPSHELSIPPPKHIILTLWPHAQPEQIQYYIQGYSALYPTSKILVLQPNQASVESSLASLLGEKESNSDSDNTTLIHVFEGSHNSTISSLLNSYHLRTGTQLDVKLSVLDPVPISIISFYNILLLLLTPFLHFWATLILWFSEPKFSDVEARRELWVFPGESVMFARSRKDVKSARDLEEGKDSLLTARWTTKQERYWSRIENAWEQGGQ